MASKETFLNQIAAKLGRTRVYEVPKPTWERHPGEHIYQDCSQEELVSLFEQEILKLGGEVIRVPSLLDLGTAIQTWLKQSKVKNVVSWDLATPVGNEVKKALIEAERMASSDQNDLDSSNSAGELVAFHPELKITFWNEQGNRQELISAVERADVGFTFAEYGLAETGSIILYNRGNAGRLVSLFPNISANIILAKDIVPRITQVLAQFADNAKEYSCINFVTGPSRSADIEMDLSIGVHGPGHFLLFLVEEYEEQNKK